jgi:hypothetical protein
VLTVWDSGWGAQPVPMGLGQFLSLRHSAVDSSRF